MPELFDSCVGVVYAGLYRSIDYAECDGFLTLYIVYSGWVRTIHTRDGT